MYVATAEHPFEAQLISYFFTYWLDKGRLNDIDKNVYSTPKMSCAVTKRWVNKIQPDFKVLVNGVLEDAAFAQLLYTELGNQQHLDRLTILLARPNGKKGRVRKLSRLFFVLKLQSNFRFTDVPRNHHCGRQNVQKANSARAAPSSEGTG